MLASLLTAVFITAVEVSPSNCDRAGPEPLSFAARGFGYVAEVFPAKSRHNRGSHPGAYFYKVDYPGPEWRVQARRLWTAELAAGQMPQAALVSMAGHLVTLDNDDQTGGDHALAIYDLGGRFVRSFTLAELLEPQELARVQWSDCGRLWTEGVRFFFTPTKDAKLYVLLPSRRVVELTLKTGALRRGATADFPALVKIIARSYPNEETEVWMLSLRFSSLTDCIVER